MSSDELCEHRKGGPCVSSEGSKVDEVSTRTNIARRAKVLPSTYPKSSFVVEHLVDNTSLCNFKLLVQT